jgi:hypothetical protein
MVLKFVTISANAYGPDYAPMILEALTLPGAEEVTEPALTKFFALWERTGDALQSLVDEATV